MATPVLMPRQGQSVESCILVDWMVKPGDKVAVSTPIASIETDKAVFEVEAPVEGTVLALFFEPGSDIPVLTQIAAIGQPGEDASALVPASAPSKGEPAIAPRPTEPAPAPPAAEPSAPTGQEAVGVSPRARKRAAQAGVAAEQLAGSGPGGRVIERDVQAAAEARRLSPVARDLAAGGGWTSPTTGTGPGGMVLSSDLGKAPPASPTSAAGSPGSSPSVKSAVAPKTVPVTGIRKIIAQRMIQSLSTTAQLSLTRSFDATAIQTFRARVKAQGDKLGLPTITVNDLIVYAAVQSLKKHPDLNAHFLGDKIVQHASISVGIAVDTPRGLMVPVLKEAQDMSLSAMALAIRPLAESCQSGNVNPDHLSGGTFTITNLGGLGIEHFTPVLNAPEVAILGVGGLFLKPVADGAGIKHVQAINLSLTIDHQAVDGAPAARFLNTVAESLENMDLLLAL